MEFEKLKNVNEGELRETLSDLFTKMTTPAFGSMSKREFEILIFSYLAHYKLIDLDEDLFHLVTSLRITRSKAREMLYEYQMRSLSDEKQLNNELVELLGEIIFLTDGKKIAIEVKNPLLVDYIRAKLKENKYLTDTSFSNELLKMSLEAYAYLVDSNLNAETKERIKAELIYEGMITDRSFASLFKEFLSKGAKAVVKAAGGELVVELTELASKLIRGTLSQNEKKTLSEMLQEAGASDS